MSLQALVWALDQPVTDSLAKLVLLALANEVNRDGTGAWPSQQTIAATVPCGIATVQRKLLTLERDGLIRRGDQALVSHYASNRRPVVWDLPLPHQRDVARPVLAHQKTPSRPITDPSAVMDNPYTQQITLTPRGDDLGHCRSHDHRRPACQDCLRTPLGLDRIRPATDETARQAAGAARVSLRSA